MIFKTIEMSEAIFYDVSCKENDYVGTRIGGPPILGYSFGVSSNEDEEEMIEHITWCLRKYNRPFIGIKTRIIQRYPVNSLWTKDKIENCIKKYDI